MSFNLSSKRPQQNATFDNDNESFTQKQKKSIKNCSIKCII